MAKTRAELREDIEKGKVFLARTDLSPQTRELAEQKLDRYYVELAFLPDEEEEFPPDPFETEPDTSPVPEYQADDPSLTWRETIWGILKPVQEGVKRRV